VLHFAGKRKLIFAANYKLYVLSEEEIAAKIKSEQEKLRLLTAK
jgi:hypothetical protein